MTSREADGLPETAAFEESLVAAAERVLARLRRELDEQGGAAAKARTLKRLGFAGKDGMLGPDGYDPRAPVKFLVDARRYVHDDAHYLTFFRDLRKVFEIGVGTGYLFAMLKTLLGIDMHGVDIDLEKSVVFRDMRKEIGIADAVSEHRVMPRRPLPIPPGTEAVTAFRTMFNQGWSVADHEWFLADCAEKLSGRKLVIVNFNERPFRADPGVVALYQRRGTLPEPRNGTFFILEL